TPLVVDEGTDTLGRQQALQGIEVSSGIPFSSVHQNNNRHAAAAFGKQQASSEIDVAAVEGRLGHVKIDALPCQLIEANLARLAGREMHMLAVRPTRPSKHTAPALILFLAQ